MGGACSKGSCGCLQGLSGSRPQPRGEIQADVSSPNGRLPPYLRGKVGEAPLFSPQSLHSPGFRSPTDWATPAPRAERPKPSPAGGFELQIQELDGEHVVATAGQRFDVEMCLSSPAAVFSQRPLTKQERQQMYSNLTPSPTHDKLNNVPRSLLLEATTEAQQLRRSLLRGSTIVFVCAGLQGKRFIYEKAAEFGVKSVILDHPDSWCSSLVSEGVIAKFLPVDMSQSSDDVLAQSVRQIEALANEGIVVDAITTYIELAVPLVARLSEKFRLNGMSAHAVDEARDKHRTRAALARSGLPTPRNALIHTPEEVRKAGEHVGFPAVLKPVSGAASLGVQKVTSMDELQGCYDSVVRELSSLVVSSGALIKGDGSTKGIDAKSSGVDLTVLLEQYLDGFEVDVDVIFSDGEWRYAAVSDNGPTLEPYFNETWAASPSLQPKDQQRELKDLAIKSVAALGFDDGVFHVECKFTSTGPQLIEVNARMGGGQVRECNLRTWGVDLVEEQLFLALGIPSRPCVPHRPLEPVAYCYVNAARSGMLKDLSCLDALRTRQNVVWAKPLVPPGSFVVGPAEGLPTWVCDLFVTGETSQKALDFLLELQRTLPFDIQ